MTRFLNHLAPILVLMTSFLPMTSSATYNVAEARIFVDKSGYDKWKQSTGKTKVSELKHEINTIFYEVNQIFKSLEKDDVYLQLSVKDIVVLNTNIFMTNNRELTSREASTTFKDFMTPTYANNPYDLAYLFTGDDFTPVDGVVYDIGAVCTSNGVGITEFKFTFSDVQVTAHEIGHLFGVVHDGSGLSLECPDDAGWVSNANGNSSSPNRFSFSSCAVGHIKKYLNKLNTDNNNCMSPSTQAPVITGSRYATLFKSVDDVCKRRYGSDSYIARERYSSYGDGLCQDVYCMIKSQGDLQLWNIVQSPEGLDCGKNKQCIQNKCIITPEGKSDISDTCPFGDQPEIKEDRVVKDCSQMDATKCLKWGKACCQACQAHSWNPGNANPGTPDEICRKTVGPRSLMARGAYATYGHNLCSHLACLATTVGTPWNYYKAPDGMICGKDKRCRNAKCIFSLHNDKTMSDACPYGDQPLLGTGDNSLTCDAFVAKHGCISGVYETCCGSCTAKDPGTPDEYCRHTLGPESTFSRVHMTDGDNFCSKLYCINEMFETTIGGPNYQAPNGMKCGKNKRCSKGKCLISPTGDPNMSDRCPYGEQPWMGGDMNTTCPDRVKNEGCGEVGSVWYRACCISCKITQ